MDALSGATIRPATEADLPSLHALVESAYRGDSARAGWTHEADILGGPRIDAAALRHALHDAERILLVAELDGAIVGSVETIDRRRGVAYLGLLSVDPERQGDGLGKRLVAAAQAAARDRFAAVRMEMTVIAEREPLIAWYERLGYRRTGEIRPFPHAVEGVTFHRGTPPEMVVLDRAL